MNKENAKKYHGYLILPRHAQFLIQELGHELFGFYVALLMLAVWSRKNKNFSTVTKTQTEVAKELKINQSTVSRNLRALEKHKYLIIRNKDYIRLGYLPLFLSDVNKKIYSKDYADLHELYADIHTINAELQEYYAKQEEE